MHKLTLTIDDIACGLSEKHVDFQLVLKRPSGETRGFVYFNKNSRRVRFMTYEPHLHFHCFLSSILQQRILSAHSLYFQAVFPLIA